MCGIVGSVGTTPGADELSRVEKAVARMAHRGPDAAGARLVAGPNTSCQLGAVRLRIIDLSVEGDQPLTNEDGTVWVAYNGELYNHVELRSQLESAGHTFRSHTDTEVLVHLYEDSAGDARRMLDRLRGMFAFAIFDAPRDRLLLARDRLGIKPLYWTSRPSGIAFSSEARALVHAGLASAEPNLDALAGYLAHGEVRGPATAFADVHELAPGHFLDWRPAGQTISSWWELRFGAGGNGGASEQELGSVLNDAVRRQLVAERPVGVFLSGGVDSGAVATVAARAGEVKTFTVTFPDAEGDESDAASAAARRIGSDHHQVDVKGMDVARDLEQIFASMDQPTIDGVNTWLVCGAARSAGLVVALSGLGGDEFFGGYPSLSLVPRVIRARRVAGLIPGGMRRSLARGAARRSPGGRTTRVLSSAPGVDGAYEAVRRVFSQVEVDGSVPASNGLVEVSRDGETGMSDGMRDELCRLEATRYMASRLLRDTDSMSMSHSLEVRVPLLDDEFVRTVAGIPADRRLAPGKSLLARAAGLESLPPKIPFTLPFTEWIRGPLRETVREGLLSETLPFGDLAPRELRLRLWERLESGRVSWSRPWAVTVLRMWPGANGLSW